MIGHRRSDSTLVSLSIVPCEKQWWEVTNHSQINNVSTVISLVTYFTFQVEFKQEVRDPCEILHVYSEVGVFVAQQSAHTYSEVKDQEREGKGKDEWPAWGGPVLVSLSMYSVTVMNKAVLSCPTLPYAVRGRGRLSVSGHTNRENSVWKGGTWREEIAGWRV